ncbi:hypothetical protein HZB88_01430 [archaeon]|nr:hypothetical protein [archaeon]
MANNQPVRKWSSGSLDACIWANEREVNGNIVSFNTVSLQKSWKDEKGQWRSSSVNLRRNDIQKAILLLQKTQEELLLTSKEEEE